jgi:hypothetical protein
MLHAATTTTIGLLMTLSGVYMSCTCNCLLVVLSYSAQALW